MWEEGLPQASSLARAPAASGGLPLPGGRTRQEGLSAQGKKPAPVWGHGAGQGVGRASGVPGARRGGAAAGVAEDAHVGERGSDDTTRGDVRAPWGPHPTRGGAGWRWLYPFPERETEVSPRPSDTQWGQRSLWPHCVRGPCAGVAPVAGKRDSRGHPASPHPAPPGSHWTGRPLPACGPQSSLPDLEPPCGPASCQGHPGCDLPRRGPCPCRDTSAPQRSQAACPCFESPFPQGHLCLGTSSVGQWAAAGPWVASSPHTQASETEGLGGAGPA